MDMLKSLKTYVQSRLEFYADGVEHIGEFSFYYKHLVPNNL